MSEKYKKTCKHFNYIELLLILVSTVTGCLSIFAFSSLVCVPSCITSSAVGIKICAITAGIKKYKSIIKKKKTKHDKIALLGKEMLNTIEALMSEPLVVSYASYNKFVSVNNVLREYKKKIIKKEIINPETSVEYII